MENLKSYESKDLTVSAIQWDGNNFADVNSVLKSVEGVKRISPNDKMELIVTYDDGSKRKISLNNFIVLTESDFLNMSDDLFIRFFEEIIDTSKPDSSATDSSATDSTQSKTSRKKGGK